MALAKLIHCVNNGCNCDFHSFDFENNEIEDLEYFALFYESPSSLCNLLLGILHELDLYPKVNGVIIPYYKRAINLGVTEAYWYLKAKDKKINIPENIKVPKDGIIYYGINNPRKIIEMP